MKFIRAFNLLRDRGLKHGFVELLRPLTFEEQVEEQRRIRDMEEAGEKWRPRKCPRLCRKKIGNGRA